LEDSSGTAASSAAPCTTSINGKEQVSRHRYKILPKCLIILAISTGEKIAARYQVTPLHLRICYRALPLR
jgi:hypothetical protein